MLSSRSAKKNKKPGIPGRFACSYGWGNLSLHWAEGACRAGRRWVVLYLDHELPEPALSQFQAHLEVCERCRNALAAEGRFLRELRSAGTGMAAPARLRTCVERILTAAFALIMTAGAYIRKPF